MRCFSSPAYLHVHYVFMHGYRCSTPVGSPIRRSSAPSLRAAPRGISLLRHVLHRHERPRHPPDALRHGLANTACEVLPRRPPPVTLSRSTTSPSPLGFQGTYSGVGRRRCGRYHRPQGVSRGRTAAKSACFTWEKSLVPARLCGTQQGAGAHARLTGRPMFVSGATEMLDISGLQWYSLSETGTVRRRETCAGRSLVSMVRRELVREGCESLAAMVVIRGCCDGIPVLPVIRRCFNGW
jgi:hypothetical protein